MNSPLNTTTFGVVEGFYGVFYTFPQRNDLIRFIGSHGYNAYLYAPKNDRQHRIRLARSISASSDGTIRGHDRYCPPE
jgi:hypothetical protein